MSKPEKVALVTGASTGIGRALVDELVPIGWKVVGVARSEDKLAELKKKHGHAFSPIVCDVADRAAVATASAKLLAEGVIPSLFFLNAGLAGEAACESRERFSLDKHEALFAVNYYGVLSWVEEWMPHCRDRKTTFVATSSVNAIFAPPTGAGYAASKAAVARAFEGMALTYHHTKMRFAVVYPGPVDTKGFKGKVPFVWSPQRMARCMVRKVLKGKSHIENSLYYAILCRLFRLLPHWIVLKPLGVK